MDNRQIENNHNINSGSNPIVVVCGPTAVGKTQISLDIARDFEMEIVSCDSMQVYKYMDIGSAKPTLEEMASIPHHMIDVVDPREVSENPKESFGVYKFSQMARQAIRNIHDRGKLPLITGGTGLYLDSIIYDIDFAASPGSEEGRAELFRIAQEEGPEELYKVLLEIDGETAERIHPNNIKRVVRAIEAARSGDNIREFRREFTLRSEYDPILIGLTRDREELYQRINLRVDKMIETGLLDEVRKLMDMGLTEKDYPMKGIGYKEIINHFTNPDERDLSEAIDQVKKNSRHYAKRQFTWFKRYTKMKWFDLTGINRVDDSYYSILEDIEEWLKTNLKKEQ